MRRKTIYDARLNILVSQKMFDQLKEDSEKNGLTLSEFVRFILHHRNSKKIIIRKNDF